jgi:signal transduction histidine kinase
MPTGGRLVIATRECGLDTLPGVPEGAASRTVGSLEEPRATVISISDEGTGIPVEILDRIFEAFFSTKGEGKGTGLGLYICRNIILEHRGSLVVVSRPGEGTTFHVILPVPVDAVQEPPADPVATTP